MKAVISSTFDNQYLFFVPITTWLWNKLGVEVICFLPNYDFMNPDEKVSKVLNNLKWLGGLNRFELFSSPEHKQATYAQCSRLYGACLDLPEDEVLITSDVDMGLFSLPEQLRHPELITIFGFDLVPDKQYPMCYASGSVKQWREVMGINDNSYQEKLDSLLGGIEADHFRGNYWGKDQETLYNSLQRHNHIKIPRARPGTQFASNRYDRDDAYLLERLNPDTIDFHMPRPGYEDANFDIILKVLQYHYHYENFNWLIWYKEQYKQLL